MAAWVQLLSHLRKHSDAGMGEIFNKSIKSVSARHMYICNYINYAKHIFINNLIVKTPDNASACSGGNLIIYNM